jgi:uncharacterized protein with PIN domain
LNISDVKNNHTICISLRFYAELNDFLPRRNRQVEFQHCFGDHTSVKHVIEALGVPHTEVDLILADQHSVDFDYIPKDGDHISIYPIFESLDISPINHLRPQPLRQPRFVLDTHLGKLAIYLRMLGFDSLYRNDYEDDELARISSQESRILLTKDRGVLKRSLVTHGYCVRASDSGEQLVEVVQRFDLESLFQPFSRCLECNTPLVPVEKEEIQERLKPRTITYYNHFNICPNCQRIYWQGSHYKRMQQFIQTLHEKLQENNRTG